MFSLLEGFSGCVIKIIPFAAILVWSSLCISCNSRQSETNNSQRELSVQMAKPMLDCIDGRDTTFSNKDYLRFVTIGDTAFDLKVGINGNETLLGFRFNCNVQSGLIPQVLKHTRSQLILVRGSGFHYREVIICSSNAGTVDVRRFETELAIGAKYDAVAYPDANDSSKIIVSDLVTKKEIVLLIGKNAKSIKLFQVTESALIVVRNGGKELVLPFSR